MATETKTSSDGSSSSSSSPNSMHMFISKDARKLMHGMKTTFIGDSNVRCMYKDLVLLLQEDRLLTVTEQKEKGQPHFLNKYEVCVYRTELTNSIDYEEERQYLSKDKCHFVEFYFTTKVYDNRTMTKLLRKWRDNPPDVVFMNSALWDTSRYHTSDPELACEEYLRNVGLLLTEISTILPKESMFVWLTTPPVASNIGASFLTDDFKYFEGALRSIVLESNYNVAKICSNRGIDVLDLHYYMRPLIEKWRIEDGVHWKPEAMRCITDYLFLFLTDTWGKLLPSHIIPKLKAHGLNFDLHHFKFEGVPRFMDDVLKNSDKETENSDLNH